MTQLPLWFQQLPDGDLNDEALQRLGEWTLGLLQAMRQGIVVADMQGTVLAFNQFMRARYGWTDADRGVNMFTCRPLLVEQGGQEWFQRLVQTGEHLELLAARNVTRQGEEVYQNFWGYPLVVADHTVGVVIQIEDVTETVNMAQELARVKDYLDDIVHSTHDAILVLDDQGRISFANDVAVQYSGCRVEELVGCRALSFIPPSERHAVIAADHRLAETGEPGYLETRVCLAADRCLDVGLTYARLRGRPGTIAILRNIEERKRLERALRTRNRELSALGTIASTVSHTLDLDELLRLALDTVLDLVTADVGCIFLRDARNELLTGPSRVRAEAPGVPSADWDLQRVDKVLETGQFLPMDEACLDPATAFRSVAYVPLLARGQVQGVLALACRRVYACEENRSLLTAIGQQIGVAVENVRLFARAQRRVTELGTLTRIGRAISAALDQDELLELVYQQASLLMDTTNFFIALYDQETDTVRFPLAVEDGVHVETRPDFAPRRAGRGLTEHVILTRAPLLLRHEGPPPDDPDIELIGPQSRSWLGVPMMIGARVLGVIAVQSYEREGAFDTGHLNLLNTIAAQAAIAMENAQLYAQAGRAEELAALHRISTLVTSSLDPQQVLDTIVAATVRVMHCQKVAIFICDEHKENIHLMASHGLSERFVRQSQRIPLTDKRATAVQQDRVFAVEDISVTAVDMRDFQSLAQEEDFRAVLDVPLRGRDRVLGSLAAYYSEPHQFSQKEIEFLTTLANHVTVAIENARLYASTDERLRERVTELATLQQVSLRLTSSLDLPTVLDIIAEAAMRLVEASDIHIFLHEQETGEFTFGAGLWDTGERNCLANPPRQDGITARTMREGRPIVINDAEHHPLYNTPEARPWGMKAIASFPLKCAGQVVGVFNVAFLHPHQFSEDELRVLGLLADQAAVAIENARLYQEAQRLSITDGLTGLYNSRHFYAILKKEMTRVDRDDYTLALVLMDIDNFKAYNDTYGHLAGDDLLQDLARLVQAQIRESDLAFRYGGEEFALLLPEMTKLTAARLAERICASLAAHEFTVKETGDTGHVTVSMGVALYPADATDERGFVYAADMAMYAAKAAGKNQVRVHDFTWSDLAD